MNLKKEYQKLYNQWLQEFENPDLTRLTDENFSIYKNIVSSINKVEPDKANELQIDLLNEYKKNIQFLFDDLLTIRELKIMNAALSLKEMDLDRLSEAETLLYQNLIATIKGYKKVKAFSIETEDNELILEKDKIHTQQPSESIISNKVQTVFSNQQILQNSTEELTQKSFIEEKEYHYVLIRFIKKTPPLVGVDLKSYGPFEEN
ncbi:MAG: hypothetical protein ACFFKA_17800, partial [Candidatus Thorarchaeota archaeon]